MSKKKNRQQAIGLAVETAGAVRGAATRSAGVARRLLRRTQLLTRGASRKIPVLSTLDQKREGQIAIVVPDLPPHTGEREEYREEMMGELARALVRAERAEQAAAWLRARLRAARARNHADTPRIDAAALSAELTDGLSRLRQPQERFAVERVVRRTLVAHGLAPDPREPGQTRQNQTAADLLPWSHDQLEALGRQVVSRAPEVADPGYARRILELLVQARQLSLPKLLAASGLSSAMSRRRLRLAAEALAALGVLTVRDGAYALNRDWTPGGGAVRSRRS